MSLILYVILFAVAFLVDVIPFVGPPAWTVMVFFKLQYNLNGWLVLLIGVTASALGRYFYSVYIKWLSKRFIKEEKNADLRFLGEKLAGKGWKVHLFVLLYTLIPVPTTPLFTASGVARIRPLHIMPAFFIGKFTSDAVMLFTGDYVAQNITSIASGLFTWQSLAGSIVGVFIISLFFFIDWQRLLVKKQLKINFHIWK